jgi:hypothetical protein
MLGLVIVVALVVIGQDLRRAKTRGPRWKRRIIAAALAILAAAGAYPVAKQHPYNQPPVRTCYYYFLLPSGHPARVHSGEPAGKQAPYQARLDLLRRFGESGILAPPVVERARKQYAEEA